MQLEKITSKENAKLKAAAKLLQSKKERKAAGAFVAEGKRLCLDAFYSGQKPLRIFVTEGLMEQEATQQELAPLLQAAPERYLIPDALAHRLSDTQSPQGLFCVFEILDNSCRLATIKRIGWSFSPLCRTRATSGLSSAPAKRLAWIWC